MYIHDIRIRVDVPKQTGGKRKDTIEEVGAQSFE